jgi:hypothetical protein
MSANPKRPAEAPPSNGPLSKEEVVHLIAQLARLTANDDVAVPAHCDMKELTEREAAADLRISVDLLQKERAAGRIGYAKSGRRVLYPVVFINKYRQERQRRECPSPSTTSGAPARSTIGTPSSRKAAAQRAFRVALLTRQKLGSSSTRT